jgi:hypothetical protein
MAMPGPSTDSAATAHDRVSRPNRNTMASTAYRIAVSVGETRMYASGLRCPM